MMKRRVAAVRRQYVARRKAPGATTASHGVASFYTEGTKTASGEKFNTLDMTAAHPTLPFGTKLRVTNVKTGQAVTVRVNDRGPYVAGRVVDVSYSAADALGMVGKGASKSADLPQGPAYYVYISASNIEKITAPVLIISGDNDRMDKIELAKTYKLLGGGVSADMQPMPKAHLAIVPNQSHVSLIMQTKTIFGYLDSFL